MAIWKRALTVSAARSTSWARRRLIQAQAKVRSMTQRLGWITKPASVRLMISTVAAPSRRRAAPGSRLREDALDEREAPGDPVEDQRRAVAILHAGRMDLDAHQAEGVGDQVPLAALDPLARVVSDHFAGFRAGFHWLSMIAAVGLSARPFSFRVRRQWRRRAAGAGPQRRAQLQGREALERDPCQHHRPGRAALSQGQRPAGGALLHRARADGEPQRADRGRGGDAGHRRRRATGGDRTRQGGGRPAAGHARR